MHSPLEPVELLQGSVPDRKHEDRAMARYRSARNRRLTRWVWGVVVAVLAVAVVLLSVLAITHARGGVPSDETPRPVGSFTPATPSATPTPSPTPTASETAPAAVAPPGSAERFLTVDGSGAIWRATAGQCGVTAPVIERSGDGGATWNDVTPSYRGIGQVLSLDAFAGDQAEIVGLVGASCEPQALRTFTYGQFWDSYPDVLAASTYVDPANPASVVTPAGAVAAPCAQAWGLRSEGGAAGLVCDGTSYQRNAGGGWDALTGGSLAIAVRDGAVVSASVQAGCSGVQVGAACVAEAAPSGPAALALDQGGELVLWTGDAVIAVPGA